VTRLGAAACLPPEVFAGIERAAGEFGRLLEADRMDERGRVPVCEPPLAFLPPEDEGHSQGPVLIGEVADFTVLPFNHHEDDEVAGRVGLDDLDLRLTTVEEPRRRFQRLVRGVEATPRLPAQGGSKV